MIIEWEPIVAKLEADISRLTERKARSGEVQHQDIQDRIDARREVIFAINDLEAVHLGRFERDYEGMKPYLPAECKAFLDIGCGSGRVAEHLCRHYGGKPIVHLLDGDQRVEPVGKEQVGFETSTHPWNDRSVAIKHVQSYFPLATVVGHPPDPDLTIPVDLIVSTLSWGHHYGVDRYLGLALRSLRPGGRLILDVRSETGGLKQLTSGGFRLIATLPEKTVKCRRHVLER